MESSENPVRWKGWESVAESRAKRKGQNHEECVLRQFGQTFVDHRFDFGNATHTKSVLSYYAMVVMDPDSQRARGSTQRL